MQYSFYNADNKKKKAKYALVIGAGDTNYDNALFYLSTTISDLLEGQYYSEALQSRLLEEGLGEIVWENHEHYFMLGTISELSEIWLSKLIEKKHNTWNFQQLIKSVEHLGWSDLPQLREAVNKYIDELREITISRNTRFAHTSKDNNPHILHTYSIALRGHIYAGMKLLDKFTDGIIPYQLEISDTVTIDLRDVINHHID